MGKTVYLPIYDISKSYNANLEAGPSKKFKATLKAPAKTGDYQVFGLKINSPFGSAACPTGADSRYVETMFDNGYDIVTTKTRRSVHFAPQPFANVVHIVPGKLLPHHDFEALPSRTTTSDSDYSTLTIANSFGNNSIDPSYWMPDARKANSYSLEKRGRLLITSIVGTIQPGFTTDDYYEDFAKTALLAKGSGARAIEINLSCPNVANEGVLCYDPEAVLQICKLVKEVVGETPVIAKFGYFPQAVQGLFEEMFIAVDPYVDAISAINTYAAPVVDDDGQQALPGKGRLKAGVSGHAIKDIGLDMTRRLAELREHNNLHYEIFSIGGVLNARDFMEYRQAGADVVLSATGAMYNPNLAAEIKLALKASKR